MRGFPWLLLAVVLALTAQRAAAQEAVVEPLEIRESGTDYLRSIRLRRIDTDVGYYDPTRPPPPLDTSAEPPKRRDPAEPRDIDLPTTLITTAILLAIGYVFLRYGGGFSVSFRSDAENAERARRKGGPISGGDDEVPASLDAILRLSDKRQALVLLARRALAATVAANGVLLQRSWTARDALRHIPPEQKYLEELRALVLASERVQFGGRDVAEDEFEEHLARIGPLIRPLPA